RPIVRDTNLNFPRHSWYHAATPPLGPCSAALGIAAAASPPAGQRSRRRTSASPRAIPGAVTTLPNRSRVADVLAEGGGGEAGENCVRASRTDHSSLL